MSRARTRRRPSPTAARCVAAAAIVAAVAAGCSSKPSSPDATPTSRPAATVAPTEGVETFTVRSQNHTTSPVTYDQTPPVGGDHAPVWQNCGAYPAPIPTESGVHSLEHGAVWITHDPELSEDDVDALAEKLPDNGIMSPYPGLPSPVVVTVWGAQLQLDGADDPRLDEFIDEYGDGSTSPEPFASCEGGLTDPQGEESAAT